LKSKRAQERAFSFSGVNRVFSYFSNAWLCGLRARSFHGVLVIALATIAIAYLAGAFSPRQPQTVILDVGITGLRLSLLLLILFWVQELITREIERKTVYFALAYPASRASYILGRYLGVLVLAGVALLIMGLLLWLVVLFKGLQGGFAQQFPPHLGLPYWITLLGIWVDGMVVGAFALWLATFSTVSLMPIACGLAFAIAGRSLGAVLDFIRRGADGDKALAESFGPLLDALQWVLPDLSRLDWRVWTLYGQPPGESLLWALVAAAAMTACFLVLAIASFNRREFL
jgi:Cu-processing system permease protein